MFTLWAWEAEKVTGFAVETEGHPEPVATAKYDAAELIEWVGNLAGRGRALTVWEHLADRHANPTPDEAAELHRLGALVDAAPRRVTAWPAPGRMMA